MNDRAETACNFEFRGWLGFRLRSTREDSASVVDISYSNRKIAR
jgi:hypothetical protein